MNTARPLATTKKMNRQDRKAQKKNLTAECAEIAEKTKRKSSIELLKAAVSVIPVQTGIHLKNRLGFTGEITLKPNSGARFQKSLRRGT
jgi:hypothetical protein